MERKLATALFVDLVDSTALVASHDPEIARRRVTGSTRTSRIIAGRLYRLRRTNGGRALESFEKISTGGEYVERMVSSGQCD